MLGEQQMTTVSTIAAQVNRGLQERINALEAVAKLSGDAMQSGPMAMQALLEQRHDLLALFKVGFFTIQPDGTRSSYVPFQVKRFGINLKDRDYISGPLDEGKTTIGQPIIGRTENSPVVVMGTPIRNRQGRIIGALAGAVALTQPNFLNQITDNRYGKTGGYLLIAPKYRLILTATDKTRVFEKLPEAGINPAIDRFIEGYEGSSVLTDPRGGEILASAKAVPAAGWIAIATLPTAEAFAPIHDMQQRMLLATLLLTLLAIAFTWWMIRRQLAPMLSTSAALAAMSGNNEPLHPLPVARPDEFGQIVGEFNRLLEVLGSRETALQESELRMRSLIHALPDLFWMKDRNGIYLACNQRFERFFGAPETAIVGKTDYDFVSKEQADFFHKHDLDAMVRGTPGTNEEWITFADDGHRELLETTKTPIFDTHHELIGVFGIGHDITERMEASEKINKLAFYDVLTGLPNRRLLLERLVRTLAACARHQRQGALLFIDLDNFKLINDTLGHDAGDLLLQQVAQRLTDSIRETDSVARLGGDEFVVMLEELSENPQEAAIQAGTVGEKILSALNQPYKLSIGEYHSSASIGIALFSHDQKNVEELLKRADMAMYRAKGAGRNTLSFFDPEMQAAISARALLETELREALHRRQFQLFYQPQGDVVGQTIGVEALIRWQHAERGLVSPGEFIPVAEESGLILPLGQWILETACAQLAAWARQPEMSHLTMAVNISVRQLRHTDFVNHVKTALEYTGANPHRLKLELTESLLINNIEDTISKMTTLKAMGVGFSLDEFGTGFSSLTYLKRLPLDQLKIDQEFVRDILIDGNDFAITKMIVALGDSLGLMVIAEGVESEAQRETLARQGCLAYQGYLFSRPLPLAEFEIFVQQKQAGGQN